MTNEERNNAIHCLKVMIDEEVCEECKLYGTTGTDHCEADCVRIAIKALEQQPCEDAISRQAVLEKAINVPIAQIVTEDEVICRKIVFVDDIENLPPVTPKQKYGKWIDGKCNKCGEKEPLAYCGTQLISVRSKFCPNCGAKMQESEEV